VRLAEAATLLDVFCFAKRGRSNESGCSGQVKRDPVRSIKPGFCPSGASIRRKPTKEVFNLAGRPQTMPTAREHPKTLPPIVAL